MIRLSRKNQLIQSLPTAERRSFVADLEHTQLAAHARVAVAGRPMSVVHFPIGAVVAASYQWNGASIELHGVGREGMLGSDVLLAPQQSRTDVVCQIAGPTLSMPFPTFERHAAGSSAFSRVMSLHAFNVHEFAMQSAACNGVHPIARRVARWLLVTSDRVGSADFALTHEALARSLGVQRPGASLALNRLQRLGWIVSGSGRIRLLDKAALEDESCECYRIVSRARLRAFRLSTSETRGE